MKDNLEQYVSEHLSRAGVTSVPEPIAPCQHRRPHLRRPKGGCPSDGFPAWSTPRLPKGIRMLLRGHKVDRVPLASVGALVVIAYLLSSRTFSYLLQ